MAGRAVRKINNDRTHSPPQRNKAFTQFFLEKIAGVQRAEPSGAVRAGRRPGGGLQLRKEVVAKRQDCIVYQRDAHLG